MKLILYNGPPRSGKDTAAKFIHQTESNIAFERYSLPNKLAFAATVGAKFNQYLELDWFEEHKEKILPQFGVSYRQWQIDFAEKFMKPLYGKSVFAKAFISRLDLNRDDLKNKIVVVPDCGFQAEIDEAEKVFGKNEVLLVRVYRKGCDFSKDSREYVYTDKFETIDVYNTDTENAYRKAIFDIYQDFKGN